MANKISSRATGPGNIKSIAINSNSSEKKTLDLVSFGPPVVFKYYESLLQDVIYATVTYVDAGTLPGGTAVSYLPITGSEKVRLQFEDVNEEEIIVELLINKVTEVYEDSGKTVVTLEMNSKELFDNDKVRLNTRLDGKISNHIETILTDEEYLNTKKELHIEDTENNYNKIMNNKKPFYMMNYFSTLAIPSSGNTNAPKNSAGYLLWETSKGFHFRSVDWLFNVDTNPRKKSIIYTETPDAGGIDIPEQYDMKALSFEKDNRNDIKSKLEQGAYSNRLITFNPFNCYYEVTYPNADNTGATGGGQGAPGSQKKTKHPGEALPVLNPQIKSAKGGKNDFSRTTFKLLDVGTLPSGSGGERDSDPKEQEQLKKSEEENANPAKTLNQAIMRLNQLNLSKISITIPGDFTLHAGDMVFVDSPMLEAGKPTEQQTSLDNQTGGLYIIRDICHYMTALETYTQINVVRDSMGRKGKPHG